MHYTIVPGEVSERNRPNIFSQFSVDRNHLFPATMVEQPKIKPGDGVAGLLEKINQMGPNVTSVASNKNFHAIFPAPIRNKIIPSSRELVQTPRACLDVPYHAGYPWHTRTRGAFG